MNLSEKLARVLENNAEHLDMDDTSTIQDAIEVLDTNAKSVADTTWLIAEALEAALPEGFVEGEAERSIIAGVLTNVMLPDPSMAVDLAKAKDLLERGAALMKEAERYKKAIEEIDRLEPNDFMEPKHLPPAFRQVDIRAAFKAVTVIVQKAMNPEAEERPVHRSAEELARAVVEACVTTSEEDDVVVFEVTKAEMHEIKKLEPARGIQASEWEVMIASAVRTTEEHLAVGMRRVQMVVV